MLWAVGRVVDEEREETRALGTGALRLFALAARNGDWGPAWSFLCARLHYEEAVSMDEPRFQTTHDPILDARIFYDRNGERSAAEVVVLLERLGWTTDVAVSAARVAFMERR